MYPHMINVPRKGETYTDHEEGAGRTKEKRIKFNMGLCEGETNLYWAEFRTSDGWLISEVQGVIPSAINEFIARVAENMRDIGFEHGKEHIRRSLGCKC